MVRIGPETSTYPRLRSIIVKKVCKLCELHVVSKNMNVASPHMGEALISKGTILNNIRACCC